MDFSGFSGSEVGHLKINIIPYHVRTYTHLY